MHEHEYSLEGRGASSGRGGLGSFGGGADLLHCYPDILNGTYDPKNNSQLPLGTCFIWVVLGAVDL